jgi:pimeloyl-ACP methyl ester carboxylesterase
VCAPATFAGSWLLEIALRLYPLAIPVMTMPRFVDFYSTAINMRRANVTPAVRRLLLKRNGLIGRGDALAMRAYMRTMLDWHMPAMPAAAAHVPALLVSAGYDLIVDGRSRDAFAEALRGARVRKITQSRHSPMYEAAAEFNKILNEFLDDSSY